MVILCICVSFFKEHLSTWNNENPYTLPVEMQNVTVALENSLAVSRKVEHRLTIWLSYPIFSDLPKRNESTPRLGYESCMFRATFIITKYGRNPSIDEWINKRWYRYVYTGNTTERRKVKKLWHVQPRGCISEDLLSERSQIRRQKS